ncbi:hypothetical protein [Snodgrassella alvi]|uniref:hypothetical protein n=1 Tax=Snodgrassella alvi TaxID=1196083 RepID=UPI000997BC25|nr:hypothetical protein [Snodgrassella alvi]MCT6888222.1 hypothetical protein [Lactobacillus sp.]OOX78471.1 hypothetical protein BGH94_08705 [Snodgrassella alvi]ORE99860.1 hypothetical protein BGH95_11405 [Snodgrassella alvi]
MAIVSVTEASKLVGKTRKTIQRYISIGKLSKTIGSDGKEGIDTSELLRVFGELSTQDTTQISGEKNIHNVAVLNMENVALKKEIELLRELLTSKDAHIDSLNKALLILEHKKEHPTPIQEEPTQPLETEQVTQPTAEIEPQVEEITEAEPEKPKRKKFLGIF